MTDDDETRQRLRRVVEEALHNTDPFAPQSDLAGAVLDALDLRAAGWRCEVFGSVSSEQCNCAGREPVFVAGVLTREETP